MRPGAESWPLGEVAGAGRPRRIAPLAASGGLARRNRNGSYAGCPENACCLLDEAGESGPLRLLTPALVLLARYNGTLADSLLATV
jgi:hypothetical protein